MVAMIDEERPAYVYVFGPKGGAYKIGWTFNPRRRETELRGGCHYAHPDGRCRYGKMFFLEKLPSQYDAKVVERLAHLELSDHLLRHDEEYTYHWVRLREWFVVSLDAAISSIMKSSQDSLVEVSIDEDESDALMSFIARQPTEMSRSQVMRYALQRLLEESGDLVLRSRKPHVRKRPLVPDEAPDVEQELRAEEEKTNADSR